MPLSHAARVPLATYRLQLGPSLAFADVEARLPALAALGIDTLYLSPILLSSPGSTHGYDVNDYRRIDSVLGGRPAFTSLVGRAHAAGIGILLDFVPNHMGIDGPFNAWWREVLELGPDSPHARFFDIFWIRGAHTRVLLPMLDDHYGRVLEAGRLPVRLEHGGLVVGYGGMTFPLRLSTYAAVLGPIAGGAAAAGGPESCTEQSSCGERSSSSEQSSCGEPASFTERSSFPERQAVTERPSCTAAQSALRAWLDAAAIVDGPRSSHDVTIGERVARTADLKHELGALMDRDAGMRARLDARLRGINGTPGVPESFDALDALLERQHYRLARWQRGAHDGNYRRFFGIDSMVGLRMEHLDVFRDSHALVRQLLERDEIDGLRIDHVDGLRDPLEYLARVQDLAPPTRQPLFVVVEKILAPDESLPPRWPVHGTTGYEFIADLAALFVDASAEEHFSRLYAEVTGTTMTFPAMVHAAKLETIDTTLAGAASMLAGRLLELLQRDRRWRDLSHDDLLLAIRELMAGLAVYRTYRRLDEPTDEADRAAIEAAARSAMRRHPLIGHEAFEIVRDALLGIEPRTVTIPRATSREPRSIQEWALTFQQYTGAVMAKGVEDTAFYRYNRLIGLNDVGGDPGRFGMTVADFHRRNEARRAGTPHGLLATATHDTKFGEDTRARLCAISEIGPEWEQAIRQWREMNRRHKRQIDGFEAPGVNEEYRLYQTLAGIWPATLAAPDDAFRQRVREHLRKSTNEARVHSSWQRPHDTWLEACDAFVDGILGDADGFVQAVRTWIGPLVDLGLMHSLAQLVLKLTAPGVPDIYQGCETWQFALVDPDNRRPVDAAAIDARLRAIDGRPWDALVAARADGDLKLRLTRDLLRVRAAHRAIFEHGDYRPHPVNGADGHRVIAYSRGGPDGRILVVAARASAASDAWKNAAIDLGAAGSVKNLLTGHCVNHDGELVLRPLLGALPATVGHLVM